MKKHRAPRLVVPRALTVTVLTVAVGIAAGACGKDSNPETNPETNPHEEEGFCTVVDPPDGGMMIDCPDPDGGVCPPGCTYV